MLLSIREKKFILKMLKKQNRSLFISKQDRLIASELIEKLEQSTRNEKLNDMKKSRL